MFINETSSDAALHHSPWSSSPYTVWRCVLGHCPVEKQMIVPLRENQMCHGSTCPQRAAETVLETLTTLRCVQFTHYDFPVKRGVFCCPLQKLELFTLCVRFLRPPLLSKVLCLSLTTDSSSGLFSAPGSNVTMSQDEMVYRCRMLW
jgi:hypothetical protein